MPEASLHTAPAGRTLPCLSARIQATPRVPRLPEAVSGLRGNEKGGSRMNVTYLVCRDTDAEPTLHTKYCDARNQAIRERARLIRSLDVTSSEIIYRPVLILDGKQVAAHREHIGIQGGKAR